MSVRSGTSANSCGISRPEGHAFYRFRYPFRQRANQGGSNDESCGVSSMKRTSKTVLSIFVCIFLVVVASLAYGLFHGLFDNGNFHVEQERSSPSKQLAVVARRSDNQALSGDQYFIVVGDQSFSSADLKRAYYHDGVVFRAASKCLTVRWENRDTLIVECKDHSIKADQIAVQRSNVGNVRVAYEGIPTH